MMAFVKGEKKHHTNIYMKYESPKGQQYIWLQVTLQPHVNYQSLEN